MTDVTPPLDPEPADLAEDEPALYRESSTAWTRESSASISISGSVRRLSDEDLRRVDPVQYSATEFIGKRGVEAFYERTLHGPSPLIRVTPWDDSFAKACDTKGKRNTRVYDTERLIN